MPRVKVCCIQSVDEAWTAINAGAAALGLVSAMPSGPGPISEQKIAEIAARVPPGVTSILLTALTDPSAIAAQHQRTQTHVIQLVDALPEGAHARLRRLLPGVGLMQVIHVRGPSSVAEALAVAPHVDAILLDSGNPAAGELGGTGRTHDWRLSRRIVQTCGRPVYLAGGLNSENVAEAVAAVEPFGLALCSGVRVNGALEPTRLAAFMANAAR